MPAAPWWLRLKSPHAHVCGDQLVPRCQTRPQPGAHRTQAGRPACRAPCSGPLDSRTMNRHGRAALRRWIGAAAAGFGARIRAPPGGRLCPWWPSVPCVRPCAACLRPMGDLERLGAVPGGQRLSPGSGGPGKMAWSGCPAGSLLEARTPPLRAPNQAPPSWAELARQPAP